MSQTPSEQATEPTAELDQGKHKPKRLLRSPKTWLIGGLALVLLAGIGIGSFLLFSPKRSYTARTMTYQVTKATQTATVSLDGTLSPLKQANLNFAVSGEVTKVYVKSGQKVSKGQKLARIDDASLQDAVDLAAANVTSAEANYDDVSDSGTSAAKSAASAQVDSAKASLASAKEDLKSAVLRSSIDGTVASVDLAVGDQVSGSGSSSSSSSGSSGSGSSGSSGSSSSGSSSSSSSSSAQVAVISTAKWELSGTVGASDLSSLKAGQAATVTVDSTEIKGTLASAGIVATSTSDGAATFPVVINLSGTHNGLYSGTTASAVITTGSYPDVLTVATAAISTSNGKTVVNKVTSSGSATVTEVSVGRVFGDLTEITSGLSEGDTVQVSFRPSSTSTSSSNSNSDSGFGGLGGIGGGLGGGQGGPPAGGTGGGANR